MVFVLLGVDSTLGNGSRIWEHLLSFRKVKYLQGCAKTLWMGRWNYKSSSYINWEYFKGYNCGFSKRRRETGSQKSTIIISLVMKFMFGTTLRHKVLFCLLRYFRCLRMVCCFYPRTSCSCIIFFLVLLKEMGERGWDQDFFFFLVLIRRMKKRSEFRISLSKLRGRKILLNSTEW